jgi:L-asparaginase II
MDEGHARAAWRLREAVAKAPFMVGGTDRFDMRVMQRLGERVFCKVAAEGLYCAALSGRGLSMALKVDDGNNARTAEVVMVVLIEACVALDDSEGAFMRSLSDVTLKNWNRTSVGALRASAELRRTAAPLLA